MQIVSDRRALHRIPELDRDLAETTAYLTKALSGLKCDLSFPMEGCVSAWFDFGADHAIAFRSDADALPITERAETDYSSRHPGRMHACGHDGHMAILLELSRRLDKIERLPHNVLLVFQSAEETTGGAKDLCATGIFRKHNVQAIFGLHLWPGLEKGVIASRKNELMARSCEVDVDITGKSSHIAKAREGRDAMTAGMEFVRRVYAMEAALPKETFRLLKFGKMVCGTVRNAISGHARIEGSLRAFQDEVFFGLRQGIVSIGQEIEAETGCAVQIHMNDGYPAVMNPPALYARVEQVVSFHALAEPSMTSEDFSWYQREMDGMFFFLGLGDTPALHADNFDFDDSVLIKGADFFEELAVKFR